MSKKVYTTSAAAFPQNRPIPVLEPALKTGNGKATFKTATAAANAAREARDEARESRDRAEVFNNCCEAFMLKAADSASEAKNYKEFIYRRYKFDFWWKLAIMALFLYDIFVRLTT